METLAKQIIGAEWRLILIFTQNFASNKTNASCIHCIQISLIHTYLHVSGKNKILIFMDIRHRALCRVRGNEASELGTHSILLFDGLPNFTDLIQVSTYLEDCFVSINTY